MECINCGKAIRGFEYVIPPGTPDIYCLGCAPDDYSDLICEYWAHIESGETWAVQKDRHGYVIESCGPLHHSLITKENLQNEDFEFTPKDAGWFNGQLDKFRLVETSG